MVLTGEDVKFIQSYSVQVIATNCDISASKDKSLPTNAYLITCQLNDDRWYDIVMGSRFDIFDAYYDRFGHVIKRMSWCDGRINPKLWGANKKTDSKKTK